MIVLQKFELLQSAVSLLYPPGCTICGKSIRADEYLCDQCETKAVRIVAPFCQKCSEPFEGSITNTLPVPTVPIARFTSTQPWPRTAVAVSFARSSTNLNTVAKFICAI